MEVLSLSALSREIIAFAKVFTKKIKGETRIQEWMLNAKSNISNTSE